jgi:hypothetical protein
VGDAGTRSIWFHGRHLLPSILGAAAMNENQELIDAVIEEMKLQIAENDWTVIEGAFDKSWTSRTDLRGFFTQRRSKTNEERIQDRTLGQPAARCRRCIY